MSLFHGLRTQVDAVLAGTGTLRAERYGRLVRDPPTGRAASARVSLPDPLAVVITRSGDVPFDIPLFQDPDSTIVLYAPPHAPLEDCPAEVRVTRSEPADLRPGVVLPRLRAEHGVRSVLCEGGPTLNRALIADDCLDELFLSVAPKVTAEAEALPLIAGPALPEPLELDLEWALEAASALYLRYAVARSR